MESARKTSIRLPDHAKSELNNIDIIRFVSALVVFLSHTANLINISSISSAGIIKENSLSVSIGQLIFCGPAAVMMFFVVSGFCIHLSNVGKDHINAFEFYTRRFVRIGIPLVFAYLLKILLLGGSEFEPLPVWSLWCELIYYLLYPVLLILIYRFGFSRVFGFSLVATIVLACQKDLNYGLPTTYGVHLTWILFLPVWMLGICVAENYKKIKGLLPGLTGNRIAFSMIALLFVYGAAATGFEFHFHRIVTYKWSMPAFGFLAAVFLAVVLSRDYSRHAIVRFLESQGRWSYSLYLMHTLGVAAVIKVVLMMGVEHFDIARSLAVLALSLASGLGAGFLFYLVCEKPSHNLSRRLGSMCRSSGFGVIRLRPGAVRAIDAKSEF